MHAGLFTRSYCEATHIIQTKDKNVKTVFTRNLINHFLANLQRQPYQNKLSHVYQIVLRLQKNGVLIDLVLILLHVTVSCCLKLNVTVTYDVQPPLDDYLTTDIGQADRVQLFSRLRCVVLSWWLHPFVSRSQSTVSTLCCLCSGQELLSRPRRSECNWRPCGTVCHQRYKH